MKHNIEQKVIVTTTMSPSFKKRTLHSIIKDDIEYGNISAFGGKCNPLHLPTVCLEDLPISNMVEIYNPLVGVVNVDIHYGSLWAYECDIDNNFDFNQKYLEKWKIKNHPAREQ